MESSLVWLDKNKRKVFLVLVRFNTWQQLVFSFGPPQVDDHSYTYHEAGTNQHQVRAQIQVCARHWNGKAHKKILKKSDRN